MQNYGTLRAELDVRTMEHALVVERAARLSQLGIEPPRSALLAACRTLWATLLRRKPDAARPAAVSRARCGVSLPASARRCPACAGSNVRAGHRSWRPRGRCQARRAAWARERQRA